MTRFAAIGLAAYVIAAAAVITWSYFEAFDASLESDREAGSVRLSEATSRLRGQLDSYKVLVNTAAENPLIIEALVSGNPATANDVLTQLALTYGAWEVDLVDLTGLVVAASSPPRFTFVYNANLIRAALNGRLGYVVELENSVRLVRFSRDITDSAGNTVGAVVVSASLAALEFEWPVVPEPVVFFDRQGVSISANRPELLLFSRQEDTDDQPFPLRRRPYPTQAQLFHFDQAVGPPLEVQILEKDIPQLQMNGVLLLDTSNARTTAALVSSLVAALAVALALIGAIVIQQRRRLAAESRHSATLEQRVEERTSELRTAQGKLVEASNLAALGRLSAGVSHELNQPLAAILNFAENGRRLIDKNRTDETSKNLSEISDQVRRINRIIGNLRAFAKQERTPIEPVDFAEIITNALDLAEQDIDEHHVETRIDIANHSMPVLAGKVRLEQVILNLVSNAIDAMQDSSVRKLSVELREGDGKAVLSIRDTGSGIKEPDRVFEPFYTTKQLGSSNGLGMGLALSFGLVTSFGGELSCRNHQDGAEFLLSLPLSETDS